MSNKFMQDLREMSEQDLKGKLEDTVEAYNQMQFDHTTKGLDNPIKLRKMRRDIARIKTEIRTRELDAASEDVIAKRDKIRKRRRKS